MADEEALQSKPKTARLLKRRFTTAEDAAIQHLVSTLGSHKWEEIGQLIPGRSARQCRERYENYLAEIISSCPWTKEDDERLLRIANECGHHWTEMAKFFPGRNPNNLKNRWHKVLSKAGFEPWKLADLPGEAAQVDNTRDFAELSDGNWYTTDELSFDWAADDLLVL
jgi:hypothetical protein